VFRVQGLGFRGGGARVQDSGPESRFQPSAFRG